MRIKVVHVMKGWDMRRLHDLREGLHAQRLKPGQCLVAFNNQRTMCRMVDSQWGVHTFYETAGFDLARLAELMKSGLFVELDVGRHEARVRHLRAA